MEKKREIRKALTAIRNRGTFRLVGVSKVFKAALYAKNYKVECLTCGDVSVRTLKWLESDTGCLCSKLIANKKHKTATDADLKEVHQLMRSKPTFAFIGAKVPFSYSRTARVFHVRCTLCDTAKYVTRGWFRKEVDCRCQHIEKMRLARLSKYTRSRAIGVCHEYLKSKPTFSYVSTSKSKPYKHRILCTDCGETQTRSGSWLRSNFGCMCTRGDKISDTQRFTKAQYTKKWRLTSRKLKITSKFKGYHQTVVAACLRCDHSWETSPLNLRVAGCPKCAPELRRLKCLAEHGVEWSSQREDVKSARRRTMIERYGVPYAMQSRTILNKMIASSYTYKEYTLGDRVVRLQGYEHYAIDWILANTGLTPNDVLCGEDQGIPSVRYKDACGKFRMYLPDLFIPSRNIIVEVKSDYTYKYARENNLRKARACRKAGFRFVFMVMGRDGRRLRAEDYDN